VQATSPLRARRLEEGMTMRELAAKAGCSFSTIRLAEGGYGRFSPEMSKRIARAVGASSLDELTK
jgi:transcriptional regulator with XRE-family HTH domain